MSDTAETQSESFVTGEKWVEEFTICQRPTGFPEKFTWFGSIGEVLFVKPNGEPIIELKQALTPAQMEAAGFPLEKVVEGFNAALLIEIDQLRAKVSGLESKLEELTKEH